MTLERRPARHARPHPPRPAAHRPGRGQPRRQRHQVHAARRHGPGRRSRRPRPAPASTSPTPASASTRPSCPTSSSASTAARGPTRRAAAAAAWAWRSSAPSSTCTAARSTVESGAGAGTPLHGPAAGAIRGPWPGRPAAGRADVASAAEGRRSAAPAHRRRPDRGHSRLRRDDGNFTVRRAEGESGVGTLRARTTDRGRSPAAPQGTYLSMTDQQHPADADDTRRHDLPTDPRDRRPGDRRRHAGHRRPSASRRPPSRDRVWSRHETADRAGRDPRALVRAGPGGRRPATTPGDRPDDRRPAGPAAPAPARSSSAAALSAVLASGGTVLALQRHRRPRPGRARRRPRPTGSTGGGSQPVTIDESSAIIAVAAKVSPAVVRITTAGTRHERRVIPETGVGSGVIYDANGWILTNQPRRRGQRHADGRARGRPRPTGTVYGIDTLTDLAIVKVDGTGLPTAALGDSDALKVGQLVVAIGSPLGTYSNTVTSGILSAKGRSITTDGNQALNNLIQTDAAINPGNSRRPAARRRRQRRRHQHRHRRRQQRHRLRHPHRHRQADHGPGRRRRAAGPPVHRRPLHDHRPPARRRRAACRSTTARSRCAGERRQPGASSAGSPAAKAGLQAGDIITRSTARPSTASIRSTRPSASTARRHGRPSRSCATAQTVTSASTLGTRPADL